MESAPKPEADSSSTESTRRLTASQITAVAAILTSLMALAVSLYETRIMRAWQQASTQPIVEVRLDANLGGDPLTFEFRVRNMGQGAAYIQGIRADVDGEPVEGFGDILTTWNSLPTTEALQTSNRAYVGYLEPGGERIPSTVNVSLITADQASVEQHWTALESLSDKTSIQICYCSVFEQCWINDFQTRNRAQSVDSCPDSFR